MENVLDNLTKCLQSALGFLQGDGNAELIRELHDHNHLPSKRFEKIVPQTIDLLHKVEQLLEPGPLVLADHFLGHVSSKCLTAAVELDIPDKLRAGPKSLHELALACEARPDRLGQVLRMLYNHGIFAYDISSGMYSNNRTSELLLSDHWTQWRNWVDLYGNEFYDMSRGIPESCRKSAVRTPAQINFDTDLDMFTYFTEQGWLPRLHRTLSGGAIAQAPGILEDYPWEEFANKTFLDIGGGGGGLVALVLRKYKNIKAGILDLPKVIDHVRGSFHSEGGQYFDIGSQVRDQQLISGDFLKEIPKFELYTMRWCLHDWDDTKALKIMTNVRESIIDGPQSRLTIFESLLTDGRMGRLSRYGDIIMMMSANGQERDETHWRALADQTGWRVKAIYPLRNSWTSAIELISSKDIVRSSKVGENPLQESSTTVDIQPLQGASEAVNSLESEKNPAVSDTICECAVAKVNCTNEYNHAVLSPAKEVTEANSLCTFGSEHPALYSFTSFSHAHGSLAVLGRPVKSHMSYLEPWDPSRGELFYRSVPDPGFEATNIKWVEYPVVVNDARPDKRIFCLDENAFSFVDDPEPLAVDLIHSLRANDKNAVRDLYYPRIEKLIKEQLMASRVIIFDHTVRKKDQTLEKNANPDGREQPAMVVHCDQSPKGALSRLEQNLPDGESLSAVLQNRVKLINVWRPINGVVDNFPLGLMDYRSLSPKNIHPCNLWRHQYEQRGQTVAFSYAEGQKWYYLNAQRVDEVTMIKIWDSKEDVIGKLCPHAAFDHIETPSNAAPRESVEVRCFAIFDPE